MSLENDNRQPSYSESSEDRRAEIRNNRRGSRQWTDGVCLGGMSRSGTRVSGEICRDGLKQTQPGAQPHKGRPDGSRQKSEAFVVVKNPYRSFCGPENLWRS
jgi:hypothetical protein